MKEKPLPHPSVEILVRWGRWVVNANRGKLGYAMGGYTERIGAGAYADPTPTVDPDVLKMDDIIRNRMPSLVLTIMWRHYVEPGAIKSKLNAGESVNSYYAELNFSRTIIANHWDELRDKKGVAQPA